MDYQTAKSICHVRSAIYRTSQGKLYWKNHQIPLEDRVPDSDKTANDWKEYDPRDSDDGSLFMFND